MGWGLWNRGVRGPSIPDDKRKQEATRPVFCRFPGFAWNRVMRGKGRKKAVKKFTTRQGLWVAVIIAAAMLTMMLLWMLGIFRFDAD
jgi:hypothetical protein